MKTSVLLHPDFFDWELDKQPLCVEMNEQKTLCSLKNTGPSQCLTPTVSYRGVALFLQKLLVPLSLAVLPSRMHHCFYQMFHRTFLLSRRSK